MDAPDARLLTDALGLLSRALEHNRDRIVDGWIAFIKEHPGYASVSFDEIKQTISTAVDGYSAHALSNDPDRLNDAVSAIASIRLDINFPLGAVMRALDGFRVVVTPMILEDARKTGWLEVIEPVLNTVSRAKIHFAEHYQALAVTKLRAQMRELESALNQLTAEKERAEQAVLIKDCFLGNISHELRTPLTVIMGFSRLLSSGAAPADKIGGVLDLIHQSGESLLGMVDDMLLMSKLESGHEKLYSHFVYITDLINEAATAAKTEFAGRRNVWEFNLPGPECFIVGDHQKLQSMFQRLFSNAIKFSPPGSKISVRAWMEREGEAFFAEVADEGMGIGDDIRDAIFDKLGAKNRNLSPKNQGLGRGLALARMIANAHGGDITLKSTARGKGSVFFVRLAVNARFKQD